MSCVIARTHGRHTAVLELFIVSAGNTFMGFAQNSTTMVFFALSAYRAKLKWMKIS
jgi:hypothetical protein